ncbi:class I SAM-dependent methyltransferase [Mangrovimonas spongiae]|uniref:Class I SAM-dependent methyltransferase n=1 Tax=Mangrovimonas spongiae TaxID=2494697 RepID=A0A428K271_9FLAO|nr:class I SAM-dependent methyltransferase [Mangrovimonas spongiae]RSK40519.1 class I SAM-dependent methyltransferase [Mangrovimonas spongiae]
MDKVDKKNNEYWKNYYNDKKVVNRNRDLQINVSRTRGGLKVGDVVWMKTVNYIIELLSINQDSSVLELCCGNGLIIGEIAKKCKLALGVDYSEILLNQLMENFDSENLEIINSDIKDYKISKNKFDAIIIYFSLQHFNEKESYELISKCLKSLKVNGKILLGDIPDLDKKWAYIDKPTYQVDYFKRIQEDKPMIGYWYQKDFFKAMNSCFPKTSFIILKQPDYQINSDYRFDVLIEKNENI